MKHLLILAALLSLTFTQAKAQQSKVNITAGLNISGLRGSDLEGFSSRTGFHAGLIFNSPISKVVNIQYGLQYSTKGARAEYEDSYQMNEDLTMSYRDEFDLVSRYLEIPVLFGFRVGKKFRILAGPSFSYLLNRSITYTSRECIEQYCSQQVEKDTGKDGFNDIDVGMNVGLAFDISKKITLSSAYQVGLLNVNSDSESSVFNRLGYFALSYGF